MASQPSPTTVEPQYIVDKKGNKKSVILDINLFEALLQELEDLYDAAHAEKIIQKKGKRLTLEEVEQLLKLEK